MSTWSEKLAEAREHLSDIRVRIQSYDHGDKPSSPPAALLREERRAMVVVAWWKEESKRHP